MQHNILPKPTDLSLQFEQACSFKQGPLEKASATVILEEIINDFCDKDHNHTFTINNDGLVLTIQDKISGVKIEHSLNLLLDSANLAHINIPQAFLDLYLEKMDQFIVKKLGLESQKKFEALCALRQSMTEEQKKISVAHRFAIFNYTQSALTYRFNEFLKGNMEFLSSAARASDSEYFQAVAFYTLSTSVILADALSKLKPVQDDAKKEIASEKTFRIEMHREEKLDSNLILNGIKQAANAKTNTFLVKEPAFISTSGGQLNLLAAYRPIPHTAGKKVFVIVFDGEHKKPIDTLSEYLSEKELLLLPTDVSYTVLLEEGPYVLLYAKTLSPLDTVENSHMGRMALRHVAKILSEEFKHSTPEDCDHQLKLDHDKPLIQRPNHGLAHAARQSRNIIDVLDFILKNSSDEMKQTCQSIKNNPMILDLIQVAALFLSVGRENEKSGSDDMSEYARTRKAAKEMFEKYIIHYCKYYGKSLLKDHEFDMAYKACSGGIQFLGSLPYLQGLSKKGKDSKMELLIYHLLTAAHLLDTPRFSSFDTCKVILEKRLFAQEGGLVKHTTEIDIALQSLWDLSMDRIRKTGDRIINAKNYSSPHTYPFYEASTSPEFCEKLLNLYKKTIYPLPPVEGVDLEKMQAYSQEAAFNLLFYLFTKNTDPDTQITYFTIPKMGNLLNLAVRHIQKMKKEEREDEGVKKFIAAMQKEALSRIQNLVEQTPFGADMDFKTINECFEKRKIRILQDQYEIEYSFYSKITNDYVGNHFLTSSLSQEQLDELNQCKNVQKEASFSLKMAIIRCIIYKQHCISANQMQKDDFYKTLLNWLVVDDDFLKKENPHLRKLIIDMKALLNGESVSQIKNNTKFSYDMFIDCLKEVLNIKSSDIRYLHVLSEGERIGQFETVIMRNENPFKQISHEAAKQKILDEKNKNLLISYQDDHLVWYVCGMNALGEVVKTEIQGGKFSIEKSIFSFNEYLANKFQDCNAQYNLGLCYEKGIGILASCISSFPWIYKAALNGHLDAQKKLGEFWYGEKAESLLNKVKDKYDSFNLWKYWEQRKIAALVDIYGGAYPDIYKKDDTLFLEYSEKLVQFCKDNHTLFPKTIVTNSILELARNPSEEEKPLFKTKRYFFNENHFRHYIDTNRELSEEDQQTLELILASFPSANDRDWPEKFKKMDFKKFPKELIFMAANAYDSNGNTMLGVAAENGKHVDALQRLIDMGADLNTPDHNMHKSPIYWAMANKLSYFDKDSIEAAKVVQCLLDNGAKIDITCYSNQTPLEYAKSHEYVAAANLIEKHKQEMQSYDGVLGWLKSNNLYKNISHKNVKKEDAPPSKKIKMG